MPDLDTLCKSYTLAQDGVEEFINVIDSRQRDIHTIKKLTGRLIPSEFHDVTPPIIIQGPKNLTVPPQSEYQFECKAEGAPTPKLTITRLEEASLRKVSEADTRLDVELSAAKVIHKNDRVQQSDEGWYRCVAANSRGVVYADAYLRVYDLCKDITCDAPRVCKADNELGIAQCVCPECIVNEYKPLCGSDCVTHFNPCQLDHKNCLLGSNYTIFMETDFCPDFTPPEITLQPETSLEVKEDESFTLTCNAAPAGVSPGPPPIIAWYEADYDAYEENGEENPNYNAKLGEGETLVMELEADADPWVFCVAHQCKYGQTIPIDIVSNVIEITVGPAELNYHPGLYCQIFGDPHVITFDGASYNFQGQCDYVLAMDCENRSWYIYGSFVECSTFNRASCLESVSLYLNDDIQIELQRGWVVNNNGERVEINQGLNPAVVQGKDGSMVKVEFDGEWLTVRYSVDFQLRWDGLMSVQILMGQNSGQTCGLCGNANGDKSDDMKARSKIGLTNNVREFGDSWRVDRYNDCKLTVSQEEWDWESKYAWRRSEAEEKCNAVFNTPQFSDCAVITDYGMPGIPSAPYRKACVIDYMRSEFFRDDLKVECIAASSYSERCGNKGHKNHLWRRQTGCAGTKEDFQKYQFFILDQGCPQDTPPFNVVNV